MSVNNACVIKLMAINNPNQTVNISTQREDFMNNAYKKYF